jgi:hypothetical protein
LPLARICGLCYYASVALENYCKISPSILKGKRLWN